MSSRFRAFLPRIVALLFIAAAGVAHADDARFDPIANTLTIPSVKVGNATYVNVSLAHLGNYVFALQGASAGSVVGAVAANYDVISKTVLIPVVRLGATTYRVLLQDVGNGTFTLASAGAVSTYTYYSRTAPGVAQTASLVNGALMMDGIALTNFSFGDFADDPSDTLHWIAPWNNTPNQPTVQVMLFCTADGKLSHVLMKDSVNDPSRASEPATNLVAAIRTAPQREGVGIYSDCSGTASKGWVNNLPSNNYLLLPNTFTTYTEATVLGQLQGAVVFRQVGSASSPNNQHNFLGLTWKGTSAFEAWQ